MSCMACCPVRPLPDSSTDAATMARARMVVVAAISLAYPVLVYLAMGRFEPRWLSLLLFALALLRALSTRQPLWWAAAAGAGLLAGLATMLNQALPLKLYPALVNVVMLTVFATSLRFGPPLVERLARLQEPDLPPFAVVYTRRVTQVWCGFFRSQWWSRPVHRAVCVGPGLDALQRNVGVRDDGIVVRGRMAGTASGQGSARAWLTGLPWTGC